MKVPFLDLKLRTEALRGSLDVAYQSVMESGCFVQGPRLASFEANFAQYCKSEFCVGVGNGLDALSLILQGYEVGPGDEVIVPSNTYIATWLAISAVGATPVPAEPSPGTWNLDVAAMEAAITSRTRAVIAVHLYGQSADMKAIATLAHGRGLKVIEDAAQAAGGRFQGQPTGSLGDATGFSFFPTKNLGCFGDGGAVVTSDPQLAERVRKLGSYGGLQRNQHDVMGRNSRLDELQAAFLDASLPMLESDNSRRRYLAALYRKELGDRQEIQMQEVPEMVDPTWHLFPVRVANRDRVRERLFEQGVGTATHYPVPPNQSTAYAGDALPRQPIAEALATEVLSLPLHPYLTEEEVRVVSDSLLKAME
ncbi:MAG: DegT/DnrJ/EryC1/StrS family aminotransferase [Deltaproteobacteria bacterium]|nr:DegT/DnrJ/EryC1/StrS family aminotransferase [Deltaproteobacteria bacterium]